MWKCHHCGETIEDDFEICWNCGTDREGTVDPEFERVADDSAVPDEGEESAKPWFVAPSVEAPRPTRQRKPAKKPAAPPRRINEAFVARHPKRLVTVISFWHPFEAWAARNRLSESGIPAFVADEHIVGTYWLYASMLGGAKVQVPAECWQRAWSILEEDRSEVFERIDAVEGDAVCPQCGSVQVRLERYWRRAVYLSWLFVGFPLPIRRPRLRCPDCGWSDPPEKKKWSRQFGIADLLVLTFLVALALSIAKSLGLDLPTSRSAAPDQTTSTNR